MAYSATLYPSLHIVHCSSKHRSSHVFPCPKPSDNSHFLYNQILSSSQYIQYQLTSPQSTFLFLSPTLLSLQFLSSFPKLKNKLLSPPLLLHAVPSSFFILLFICSNVIHPSGPFQRRQAPTPKLSASLQSSPKYLGISLLQKFVTSL